MLFIFKLVYTELCFEIRGNDMDSKLDSLLDYVANEFAEYVNFDLFYLDYVVSGVHNGKVMTELSAPLSDDELNSTVGSLFCRQGARHQDAYISFYVRPMLRKTGEFMRLDNYNIQELFAPEDEEMDEETVNEEHIYEEVVDTPFSIAELDSPPGLSRNVEIILVN